MFQCKWQRYISGLSSEQDDKRQRAEHYAKMHHIIFFCIKYSMMYRTHYSLRSAGETTNYKFTSEQSSFKVEYFTNATNTTKHMPSFISFTPKITCQPEQNGPDFWEKQNFYFGFSCTNRPRCVCNFIARSNVHFCCVCKYIVQILSCKDTRAYYLSCTEKHINLSLVLWRKVEAGKRKKEMDRNREWDEEETKQDKSEAKKWRCQQMHGFRRKTSVFPKTRTAP